MKPPHISVCICTYRRPKLLAKLLDKLQHQVTENRFTFSIVVADNDPDLAARPVIEDFARRSQMSLIYCAEPRQNIALVRNRALQHARGDYLAFIDDDEFPAPEWLLHLFNTCVLTKASAVLGPVRPHFDERPPQWLIDGRFCERPEHTTGAVLHWSGCRTGNVLFRRDLIAGTQSPFRAEFGTGGEDVDFFRRMSLAGHSFVWCNEAPVFEVVPPSRWTRRFMFKRALLRGRNNLKLGNERARALLKSFIAVPAYSLVLPGTFIFGQHVFMKYGIKLCDHLGRVLALFHLNPVKERPL